MEIKRKIIKRKIQGAHLFKKENYEAALKLRDARTNHFLKIKYGSALENEELSGNIEVSETEVTVPTCSISTLAPNEDCYPPLEIEFVRPIGHPDRNIDKLEGRRIVDLAHVISQARQLESHECRASKKGYLSFDHEYREGLRSKLVLNAIRAWKLKLWKQQPQKISILKVFQVQLVLDEFSVV